ncbi:hypothetical protein L484_011405 [Morus notabilis]|uniref:Uncharacterized protein n=1 Tax=Morus notabilis TaxID=981085 RepID=W9S0H7_9ROSA|nr:hypothetical protein L484_011405 [Morus notabilis]
MASLGLVIDARPPTLTLIREFLGEEGRETGEDHEIKGHIEFLLFKNGVPRGENNIFQEIRNPPQGFSFEEDDPTEIALVIYGFVVMLGVPLD